MKVDFIGIGAPKSATSWIFKCLESHPQVCTSSGKETNFFLKFEDPKKNMGEYEEWFKHCTKSDIKGEFSVEYFVAPDTPNRIKSVYPEAKLIVALRNPVGRSLSHIKHEETNGRLTDNISLEKAIDEVPNIVNASLYAKQLQHWLQEFDTNQFYIIYFDDIKNNPQSVVKNLYSFLEVDDSFEPDIIDKKYNTSAARSSKLFWWMNKAYLKLQNIPGGSQLIDLVRTTGLNTARVEQMLGAGEDQDNQFSKEEKDWLYEEYFKEDINKLEAMLDTDLSSWKRKA